MIKKKFFKRLSKNYGVSTDWNGFWPYTQLYLCFLPECQAGSFLSLFTIYNVLIYNAQQIDLKLHENRQVYFCSLLCPQHLSCSLNSTNIIRTNELPLWLMLDTNYEISESTRSLHQAMLKITLPDIIS